MTLCTQIYFQLKVINYSNYYNYFLLGCTRITVIQKGTSLFYSLLVSYQLYCIIMFFFIILNLLFSSTSSGVYHWQQRVLND
jgi:hypothetical protein